MTATTQDRELSHPAARAAQAIVAAMSYAREITRYAPPLSDQSMLASDFAQILEGTAEDIAALYQDIEAKDAQLAALRESCCDLAQDKVALEHLDTKRVAEITELKNRLAMASRDVEQLHQRASIRLQAETSDFNLIRDVRDTLDPTITTLPNGARLQRANGVPR